MASVPRRNHLAGVRILADPSEVTHMIWIIMFVIFAVILFFITVRMNYEWQKAIILRFGKFKRLSGPGLFFVYPFVEKVMKVDTRLITLDIQKQEVITKDNVSVHIDAVVFYKILNVKNALLNVQHFETNIYQQSLSVLRDVVGQNSLDELLSQKDKIGAEIKEEIDKKTEEWGIDIDQVKLQNIELPEDMKRIMARQAEAEREGKGIIITANSEMEAAKKLREAAKTLSEVPGALQLRMMTTISDVSQDRSNTIVFALPMDVMTGKGAELASAAMSKLAATFPEDKKEKKPRPTE